MNLFLFFLPNIFNLNCMKIKLNAFPIGQTNLIICLVSEYMEINFYEKRIGGLCLVTKAL